MFTAAQILCGKERLLLQLGSHPDCHLFRQGAVIKRDSIDKHTKVSHFDFITWNTNHCFHQPGIVINGKKNDNITKIRIISLSNSIVGHRNTQTVGEEI
jgi:hypothetical protein